MTLAQPFGYSKFFISKADSVSYEASPLTSATQGLITMNSSYIGITSYNVNKPDRE
jgi:hypothetical protein